MNPASPLITAVELAALISADNDDSVVVIDASWHLPTVKRNAYEEYLQAHIKGAVFFDIDAIADKQTDLPHMLPSETEFSFAMNQLGIGTGDHVVVYDSYGLFSAARVWWMFKIFGHHNVQLLDGGLPGWALINGAMDTGEVKRSATNQPFSATLNQDQVCDWKMVLSAIETHSACILDARPKARFDAAVPEPRQGLRSGHMPGAVSLPFTELLVADEHDVMRLRPATELSQIFKRTGVVEGTDVITTCGSGVTAAVITLALNVAGLASGRLYDGSWTEWGGLEQTPVVS